MLQGLIIKKVIDVVMKQVLKQFKLDKVLDYVEKPNDLDKQVEVLQKTVNKYGKYIEEIEKDIAEIKSISHKPINGLTDRLKKLEKRAKF